VAKRKVKLSTTQTLGGLAGVWLVLALASGAWMAWLGAGAFSAAAGASHVRRHRRGRRPVRRRPASGRAPAGRKPRQAPLVGYAQRTGRPRLGPTRCSAACRSSRKPAYDRNGVLRCDCPCKGRDHGKYRPDSAAAIRGSKVSPAVRARERKLKTEAANRRYEDRQRTLQAKVKMRDGRGSS
jgi:hypothetical protein